MGMCNVICAYPNPIQNVKKRKMRKVFIYMFASLFLFSCSESDESIVEVNMDSEEAQYERDINKLLSLGFDTTDVQIQEDYYVVENDILIRRELLNSISTRQYHTTNTVVTGQLITVGVNSTSLMPSWANAIAQVCLIYNQNTGLALKYLGYSNNADIVISKQSLAGNNVCAQGEFPGTDGKPGKHVYINSTFYQDIDNYLNNSQKIFLLMHVIGHNLGLRHSNCFNNGEVDGGYGRIHIPNTPNSDNLSYMKSSTCNHEWTGITQYDAIALNYLFPEIEHHVHFYNTSLSDVSFYVSTAGFSLSRTIFPTSNNYAFRGWCNDMQLSSLYDYNVKLFSDKTLYPRWSPKGTLQTSIVDSPEGVTSQTLNIPAISVVTLKSQVYRGNNTWYNLQQYDDTYTKIEGTDYSETFIMNSYMNNLTNEISCTYTKTLVLLPGTYTISSAITTHLGIQNGASGNHGHTRFEVSFY